MYRILIVVPLLLALVACVSSNSPNVYTRGETRSEQRVRMAVVDSVREVLIEGTRSGVGAVAGGAVGGVAGSTIGSGKTSTVGSIIGAVVGGVAGAAAEQGATRKKGLEITVKLDNGELRAIVQEADEQFKPGDRVRLVSGSNGTRVTH